MILRAALVGVAALWLAGAALWARAGRPGLERLPARWRGPARALPLLALPCLASLVLLGWLGSPRWRGWGRRRP